MFPSGQQNVFYAHTFRMEGREEGKSIIHEKKRFASCVCVLGRGRERRGGTKKKPWS